MYDALMLGTLLISLLFDDLSGHFYPSTFLMFFYFYFPGFNVIFLCWFGRLCIQKLFRALKKSKESIFLRRTYLDL